jgi:hypothetical protein
LALIIRGTKNPHTLHEGTPLDDEVSGALAAGSFRSGSHLFESRERLMQRPPFRAGERPAIIIAVESSPFHLAASRLVIKIDPHHISHGILLLGSSLHNAPSSQRM